MFLFLALFLIFQGLPTVIRTDETVALSSLKPGYRITVGSTHAEFVDPPQSFERLLMHTPAGSRWLLHLDALKGAVEIKTEQQALEYVRLRTAYSVEHMWRDRERCMEIVTVSEAERMPDFGIDDLYLLIHSRSDKRCLWIINRKLHTGHADSVSDEKRVLEPSLQKAGNYGTGFQGIVHQEAYTAGKFTPAAVKKENTGFVIQRWVLRRSLAPRKTTVDYIQEVVLPNGGYRRKILRSLPPPILPQIDWSFVEFSMFK